MKTRPRLLVVTPTLGESRYLARTLASVLLQQQSEVDVLHVIAAPAPRQIALQLRFPYARVVPDAGKPGGIYGALNAGLAAAKEEWDWFTYINDDDLLLPGCAAALKRHLETQAVEGVIYGDVDLIDERDRILSRITVERNPAWIPPLLQQGISPLMQQGMLFRREVVVPLTGFDTRYRLCADLDFWLRAFAAGAGFRHHDRRVAQFRLRRGQLSGNTETTKKEQDEIVGRLLPVRISAPKRWFARWRYRWCNLPRYAARVRARGWRTSYELLEREGSRS